MKLQPVENSELKKTYIGKSDLEEESYKVYLKNLSIWMLMPSKLSEITKARQHALARSDKQSKDMAS